MNASGNPLIKRWGPRQFFLLLLLVSWACNRPSVGSQKPENLPDEIDVQLDIALGSGPFIYTDTGAGLSDLSSYQSTLKLSFEGTLDGQPATWSRTYTMLATNDPAARQWTIESNEGEARFLAEMNGVDYDKIGEGACSAIAIKEEDLLSNRLALSSFLTGVLGADEAGSETVNDIAANHYTFDQRALAEQDISESNGEIWVAPEGGYIVKYLLTTKADETYFGDGVAGTLRLDYQLSNLNAPATFTLPDDCPAGMIDAPLLPDAVNVERYPGSITYESATSFKEAAKFYQTELPKIGWAAQDTSSVADDGAYLQFVQGDQDLTLVITPDGGITTVDISAEHVQK